jgi:hypothetical protein
MAKIPCKGKTISGAPCRAPARASGLCFLHENPEKAHTLGRIGGRKNRAQTPEPIAAGSLTAGGLCDILAQTIHDVRSKKMPPRAGLAIAQLSNSAHRVLQVANLEVRLARLEQRLAERQSRTSVDADAAGPPKQEESCGGADDQTGDVARSGGDAEDRNDGSCEDEKA